MKIIGRVIEELKEARALGYPTANLAYTLARGVEPPTHGVYVGYADIPSAVDSEDKKDRYAAAIVIGGDFGDYVHPKCEAYLLDFSSDLYGKEITLALQEKIRDLIRFSRREDMIKKIEEDVAYVRRHVALTQQ